MCILKHMFLIARARGVTRISAEGFGPSCAGSNPAGPFLFIRWERMIFSVLFLVNTSEVIVRDLMKESVSIDGDATIEQMLELLKKEKVVMIPVVDKNNVLIGAVTEYDLIKLVKRDSPSPLAGSVWLTNLEKSHKDWPVKEIMTANVISIPQNDNIDEALKIMNNYSNLRVLPVVDSDNKLLGVLRIRDIFAKLLSGD